MNIFFIFNFFLYLSIAIVVGSILLRLKKKFRLHRPILIAVLLFLSSFFGLRSYNMLNMEEYYLHRLIADVLGRSAGYDMPHYLVGDSAVEFVFSGANITMYLALAVIAVVCLATVVESISMGIRHLRKKRRQQKAAA